MSLLLALSCTTLHTVDGARTLEPKEVQVSVAGSVQGNQNGFSVATGIPVGQGEAAVRVGLVEDLDIGTRVYIGGVYTDLRYRFARAGAWDLAVAPGMGGLFLPVPNYSVGTLDFRAPLRAERDLGKRWNLSVGTTPMARRYLGGMDLYLGANARFELELPVYYLGLGADVLAQPAHGYPPAWVAGIDMGLRIPPKAQRKKR